MEITRLDELVEAKEEVVKADGVDNDDWVVVEDKAVFVDEESVVWDRVVVVEEETGFVFVEDWLVIWEEVDDEAEFVVE